MIGNIFVSVGFVTIVVRVLGFRFESLADSLALLALIWDPGVVAFARARQLFRVGLVQPWPTFLSISSWWAVALGLGVRGCGLASTVRFWSIRLLSPGGGQRQDQGGEAEHGESSGPAQRLRVSWLERSFSSSSSRKETCPFPLITAAAAATPAVGAPETNSRAASRADA